MYTLTHTHSHKINVFYKEGALESGVIHNSIKEGEEMTPESLQKLKDYLDRVDTLLKQDPKKHEAVIAMVADMGDIVFNDPESVRTLGRLALDKQKKELDGISDPIEREKITSKYLNIMFAIGRRIAIAFGNETGDHTAYDALSIVNNNWMMEKGGIQAGIFGLIKTLKK